MADWSSRNIMLTTKGAAAISKVQSGSGKLTITKVVASEQYVSESTLREVTSLSVENLPLTIIDRHEVPDGGSVIQVQLNNLDLAKPFVFNEIGVFATHSDNPSEEFLYIIAQVDADTGDRIPLYSTTPITATYDIYLYNVGADNIEVTISSSGLVTYEALNEACGMVKRSTSYAEEDIRYSSSLPIPYYLKCKVAGTTSSSSFVIPSDIEEGDTITDGTVVWEVLRLASNDELQTAVNVLSDGIVSTNTALAESTGYGIVSGCEPSINGLIVTVSAGVIHTADGRRVEVPEQSITLDAADATNARIDTVCLDTGGIIHEITGTPTVSPVAPSMPENCIIIGTVHVAAGTVVGEVDDARFMAMRYHNLDVANVKDYGARGNGAGDDTAAIQQAIDSGKNIIVFPAGYYNLSKPLIIPRQGMSLIGAGNMCVILQAINSSDVSWADYGMITFTVGTPETDKDVWGSWGIVIRHLHLQGHGKKMHGVYLRKIGYPLLYDVNIENFKGAGLRLDKCQDGSFENCNIQLCGRVKDGGDSTKNEDCEWSAIHIYSTVSGDNCNMLRFNKCQIENNNCSPYVKIEGGIGLWFDQTHGEDRVGSRRHDFMLASNGDIDLTNLALSHTLRHGFIRTGYGMVNINGGRTANNILFRADGARGSCRIVNVDVGNIDMSAYGLNNGTISNCHIQGELKLSYPCGSNLITNNKIDGNVTISNYGGEFEGTSSVVQFMGNNIHGNFTKSGEARVMLYYNFIKGSLAMSGSHSYAERNIVEGGVEGVSRIDTHSFIDKNRIMYAAAPPVYSYWRKGDIVYNTDPAAGEYIGWVCLAEGRPGTWKGFGLIAT